MTKKIQVTFNVDSWIDKYMKQKSHDGWNEDNLSLTYRRFLTKYINLEQKK